VAELEEINAQMHVELSTAQSRLVEAECHEQALTSNYEGLKNDFDELCAWHDIVVKEKADLEKTEC
jgi:hypothetical protein